MPNFTRYCMYNKINKFFEKTRKGNVLCISGAGYIANLFHPSSKITETQYPDVDIHKMKYSDDSYDFVVVDQVFEHIKNPFIAIEEVRRVLKKGGWAIITTVFMYPIHKCLNDYWRFTPDALRLLCKKYNKIYQCDGWGNTKAVDLVVDKGFARQKIELRTPLKKITRETDENKPIVTWIIAQK